MGAPATHIGGVHTYQQARSVGFFLVVYVLLHVVGLRLGSAAHAHAHSAQPEAQDKSPQETIVTTTSFAPPVPTLEFVSYLLPNMEDFRGVVTTDGTRINVNWKGGNWSTSDGKLVANVLPGVGAEHGYIDTSGVIHVSGRYTVQFVSDEKYGFVTMDGFGTAGVSNEVTVLIETDSLEHRHLNSRTLYAPGVFSDEGYLVAPHWSFDVQPHDHNDQHRYSTTTTKKNIAAEGGITSWLSRTLGALARIWHRDKRTSSTTDL